MAKVDAASIAEEPVLQTKIFPNPATDVIYLDNARDLKEVKIYSASGQLFFSSEKVNESISVENYPPGIYSFLATGIDGKLYRTKFIVQ